MKTRGIITSITVPFRSRKTSIAFEVDADPIDVEKYAGMDLDITFQKHREHRSLDANRMLWACLGEIAAETGRTNWDEYLDALKDYGIHTLTLVDPGALDTLRRQWREIQVVGSRLVPDPGSEKGYKTMLDVLCFVGSSDYNSKEFSVLLNGVMDNMRSLGLTPPPDAEMRAMLEAMEKRENDKAKRQQKAGQGVQEQGEAL